MKETTHTPITWMRRVVPALLLGATLVLPTVVAADEGHGGSGRGSNESGRSGNGDLVIASTTTGNSGPGSVNSASGNVAHVEAEVEPEAEVQVEHGAEPEDALDVRREDRRVDAQQAVDREVEVEVEHPQVEIEAEHPQMEHEAETW